MAADFNRYHAKTTSAMQKQHSAVVIVNKAIGDNKLLVREDKECCIFHLILIQHLCELLTSIFSTVTVIAVNHKDQTLCVLIVVPPQWTDLVLAANIPHSEADVLVLNGLN